jgi:hypothetical protein
LENDAKLDFPYDFTFLQSLLVDYLKTMNMDLTPFAVTIVNCNENISIMLRKSKKKHIEVLEELGIKSEFG